MERKGGSKNKSTKSSGRRFSIIVAATKEQGIGFKGKLPWHLPKEMNKFKQITSTTTQPNLQNAVIMGRKTFECIPSKFRPLTNRLNIILSSQPQAKYVFTLLIIC